MFVRITLDSPIFNLPKVSTSVLHLEIIEGTIFLLSPKDRDRCYINVAHQRLSDMIDTMI